MLGALCAATLPALFHVSVLHTQVGAGDGQLFVAGFAMCHFASPCVIWRSGWPHREEGAVILIPSML